MVQSEATRYSIFPSSNSASFMDNHPAFLLSLLIGIQFAGQFSEVLSGVI